MQSLYLWLLGAYRSVLGRSPNLRLPSGSSTFLPTFEDEDIPKDIIPFVQIIELLQLLGDEITLFDPTLLSNVKSLSDALAQNVFQRPVTIDYAKNSSKLAIQMAQHPAEGVHNILAQAEDFLNLLPAVFSVRPLSLRSVFHISLGSNGLDLQKLLSIKDLGIGTLYSSGSFIEVVDSVILSQLISVKTNLPFIHCFQVPTEIQKQISLLSPDQLRAFIPTAEIEEEDKNESLSEEKPLFLRTESTKSEIYLNLSKTVTSIFEEYALSTGRSYRLFDLYGSNTASFVIVVLVCSDRALLKKNIENLLAKGIDIAVVVVRLYRPWSIENFLETISTTVKHVAVIEQCSVDENSSGGFTPLYQDVTSSLITQNSYRSTKVTFHYLADGNLTEEHLLSFHNAFTSNKLSNGSIVVNKNSQVFTNVPVTLEVNEKTSIEPYIKAIEQVVGKDNLEVFAAGFDSSITSAEYAFGLYISQEKERRSLIARVKEEIETENPSVSQALLTVLKEWYKNYDIPSTSSETSKQIQILLPKESGEFSDFIGSQTSLFPAKSFWIVGGENWMYDILASGIHTILRSKKNINLLLVNTSLVDRQSGSRRKDVGLFAMNYGSSFVAGTAAHSSYSQLIRAVAEGNAFAGPSILLAYSPTPEPSDPLYTTNPVLFSLTETKKAVDNGRWPLYRYNPNKQSSVAFELDSSVIKKEIENFLKRENQLTLLSNSTPDFQKTFPPNYSNELQNKHFSILSSYDSLLKQLRAPDRSLIILYGSDGGNAEEASKRIANDLSEMKYSTRVSPMNDVDMEQIIIEESIILFVVSTAGQGEFPMNCKQAWKQLEEESDVNYFKGITYSVFGLGDSHYWPKPEEKGYYCKSGRDLDRRIDELGGSRLTSLYLGDDQDDDGWETGFNNWRGKLWEALDLGEASHKLSEKKAVRADDDIKESSNFLRGTIAEGLLDTSTLALSYENTKLTKFHGIYQQDDRDLRAERQKQGLEKAFSFMVRIRAPAGVCTPAQWQMFDRLAGEYGNDTFKLTTRQAVQLHGILKFNLKQSIKDINQDLMDTLAACGDVNRNVMCNPNPDQSEIFGEVHQLANRLSEHLTPRTSAYHEIWLDKKKVSGDEIGDIEPLYGPSYLPRKFKIAIAVPPHNDVDVLAHCLGFIAIIENEKLVGFNVSIGGGMGMTHNNVNTYPRLADLLGFCSMEQCIAVSEAVLLVQRDFGDRENRKHARLKYTLEDHGMDWFRERVEEHLGWKLLPPKSFQFVSNGDRYGWVKGVQDLWHFTLWVENGRIRDLPDYPLRKALLELSYIHTGDFRVTANQNIIISNVTEAQKPLVQALMDKYRIHNDQHSGLRLNSVACVALPTCGLALAESERYLPVLISKIDTVLDRIGLRNDAITIRMSGCPNGCSRPFVAEIAMVGRAPGIYNLYLGGGFSAERLCKLYKDSVNEDQILEALTPLLEHYAKDREENEKFGDFVIRQKYIKPTLSGKTFHDDIQ